MFQSLSKRLTGVLDKLRSRGSLTEADVTAALREVRIALLEADVALPVVKQFVDGVKGPVRSGHVREWCCHDCCRREQQSGQNE